MPVRCHGKIKHVEKGDFILLGVASTITYSFRMSHPTGTFIPLTKPPITNMDSLLSYFFNAPSNWHFYRSYSLRSQQIIRSEYFTKQSSSFSQHSNKHPFVERTNAHVRERTNAHVRERTTAAAAWISQKPRYMHGFLGEVRYMHMYFSSSPRIIL